MRSRIFLWAMFLVQCLIFILLGSFLEKSGAFPHGDVTPAYIAGFIAVVPYVLWRLITDPPIDRSVMTGDGSEDGGIGENRRRIESGRGEEPR